MALLLLILPVQYIACFLLAGAIHEIGHLLALKCMKVPVVCLRITVSGAVMETGGTTPEQELICAAAGPFAGILTCLTARIFPLLGVCAFVQTVYNLLPLYPFDGGRICRSVLAILAQQKNSLQR